MLSFQEINAVFDRQFAGRSFEVYSVVSGESLSKAMSFNDAWDARERMLNVGTNEACIDIREA